MCGVAQGSILGFIWFHLYITAYPYSHGYVWPDSEGATLKRNAYN